MKAIQIIHDNVLETPEGGIHISSIVMRAGKLVGFKPSYEVYYDYYPVMVKVLDHCQTQEAEFKLDFWKVNWREPWWQFWKKRKVNVICRAWADWVVVIFLLPMKLFEWETIKMKKRRGLFPQEWEWRGRQFVLAENGIEQAWVDDIHGKATQCFLLKCQDCGWVKFYLIHDLGAGGKWHIKLTRQTLAWAAAAHLD
jgi:hypothetical protein